MESILGPAVSPAATARIVGPGSPSRGDTPGGHADRRQQGGKSFKKLNQGVKQWRHMSGSGIGTGAS